MVLLILVFTIISFIRTRLFEQPLDQRVWITEDALWSNVYLNSFIFVLPPLESNYILLQLPAL